ncbi:MAG: hypothetical protein D6746_10440, partial [Bacteroidetes bacterium]
LKIQRLYEVQHLTDDGFETILATGDPQEAIKEYFELFLEDKYHELRIMVSEAHIIIKKQVLKLDSRAIK